MDSFPSSFSFSNASTRHRVNTVSFHEDLATARKYVNDRYEKFLTAGKEYYTINLKDFSGPVKTALICEVFKEFPHIGYKGDVCTGTRSKSSTVTPDNSSDIFSGLFRPFSFTTQLQQNEQTRHKIVKMSPDNLETHHDEYVIAITHEFANTMVTGTW
jgi:hypothetical protein